MASTSDVNLVQGHGVGAWEGRPDRPDQGELLALRRMIVETLDPTQHNLWKRLRRQPKDQTARNALVDLLLEANRNVAAAMVRKGVVP